MEVLKQKFRRNLMLTGFENLEWFAECFSVESSDFISNVLLVYKEDRVNFSSMDRTALCELLKKANLFDTTVDEFLGVKLHLYCNKDKLDSYYNWLRYKFSKLYMHKLRKCGKKFFTPSEVDSFYRSLASKLKKLEYTLYNTDIFMLERNNDILGVTERILFLDVDYISRALNEVILKSEDYPYLIVCCKTSKIGLYSYWKDDKIVHRVVNSKGRVEKIIKYIDFLK
jgi:hypothetical protein